MKMRKITALGVMLVFTVQTLFMGSSSWGEDPKYPTSKEILSVPPFYNEFQTPNMSKSTLKNEMNACNIMYQASEVGNTLLDGVKIFKAGKKTDHSSDKISDCSAECKKPTTSENPSCLEFGGQLISGKPGETADRRMAKSGARNKIESSLKEIDTYLNCLEGKKSCEDQNKVLLDKQLAAFDCQKRVLMSALQTAEQAMTQVIQNNKNVFNKMNMHQSEIEEQVNQVDILLGGDPELRKTGAPEMQGLIGMQKQMYEELGKMNKFEADAKNRVKQLSVKETSAKQKLKRETIRWAANCMNSADYLSSGGEGKTALCVHPDMQMGKDGQLVPVLDASGNPKMREDGCSPLTFLRGKIGNAPFLTDKGQYLMKGNRRDQASKNLAAFNSLWSEMMLAMGYQFSMGQDGKPQMNEAALPDTKITTWDDLKGKFGKRMAAVSSMSGFDVAGTIQQYGTKCFNKADDYKTSQMNDEQSAYKTVMNEVTAERNSLNADLDSGISSLKKNYSDVMSVLKVEGSDVPTNIQTNAACSKDVESMTDCFSKMRSQVNNLLKGEGMSQTAKIIQGGTMTSPLVIPCMGLDQCITKLKDKRSDLKKFEVLLQKAKTKNVNDLNSNINKNMNGFKIQLSFIQNGLKSLYDDMKVTLRKMKVTAPEDLQCLKKEPLKQMQGEDKNKTPGPYDAPSSMGMAMSSIMEPCLVDLNEPGLNKSLEDADKNLAQNKEEAEKALDRVREMRSKYANVESECSLDYSNSVGSSNSSCGDCNRLKSSCTDRKDQSVLSHNSSLDEIMMLAKRLSRNDRNVKMDEIDEAFKKYDSITMNRFTDFCKTELSKCEVCLTEGKTMIYEENNKKLNDDATKGTNKTE
jgi:hypothetical protein